MRPVDTDRRTFLSLGIGALVVASLPASLRRRRTLVRRRIPIMGTVAEVALPGPDGGRAQKAIDESFDALRRVEALMTRFRPDSDVGRLNAANGRSQTVSEETSWVLEAALHWARASDGRFDPCLGAVTELWDASGRHRPPSAREIAAVDRTNGWRGLDVDHHLVGARARLSDRNAAVDLGGIAKGYAVDAAVEALRRHGYADGLVNVGGDLVALGADVTDEPWAIGIRSPAAPDAIVEVLEVSDAAVATSGDYVRFFEHGGTRYHHLLDPRTAAPFRTATRSLTIRADRCVDADAAATALFAALDHEADAILRRSGRDAEIVHRIQEI